MYNTDYNNKFTVIDIDPYGSMVPYIHSALKAIENNGMLCITSTDTKVLCGNDKHKCFYLYGSARGGNSNIEETGIRIALGVLSRTAGQQSKSIKVLLTIHSEFYIRVFVQVARSKKEAWKSLGDNGLQFFCNNCHYVEYHKFGSSRDNEKYMVNAFSKTPSYCESCNHSYTLSKLTRRPIMDWSALRLHIHRCTFI